MRSATYKVNAEEILDKAFSYLVSHGLENITIRELCKGTGIALGSIYYWFGDKNNLICEVSEYGLKKVVDRIFTYAFDSINDIKGFFDGCLDEIGRYKAELRFIYQMASSPAYGTKIREKGNELDFVYEKYASRLAEGLQCTSESLRPLVYLFISAVLDYIIWEDVEKTRLQFDYIYAETIKAIDGVNCPQM